MTIEHNAIVDPEIHEPKGAAAAAVGQIYIADGSASGVWTKLHHGTFFSEATQTVTGATTWTNTAFELEGHKEGITHSISTNNEQITIAQTGHYVLTYTLAGDSSSGTSILECRITVDGTELAGSTCATTIVAADTQIMSSSIMTSLTLNEVIRLQFYSDTANGQIIYPGAGATSQVTGILNIHQVVE